MIIRTQKINVFHENSNKLQESAVFHDHETIDTSTNTMSWISIMIQLQDHISIWQARSEAWCANMMITRFACECKWQMNHKSISDPVIFRMIWKDMTCFHRS